MLQGRGIKERALGGWPERAGATQGTACLLRRPRLIVSYAQACRLNPALLCAFTPHPTPLQSPGTRASIDAVNARVKASAAAQAAFELRPAQPGPADCTPPVAAAACKAPRCRAFSAIRLC